MQLGFIIDHSRCIGCHACTVACKAENDVPLGDFRTWVKYTERGEFPEVKRSFAVLRCNQCTAAPCVTICPVSALAKRPDGIVDVDPAACIGCKSCMQACPYDALYLNDAKGTAEKCHFCAHRVERGLAPACAVVCPTEAIIPGDFHDPNSRVSRIKAAGGLQARKTEAGTGPNVWYREVDEAGIEPLTTTAAGGYLWADRRPGAQALDEQISAAFQSSVEARAQARTTYDVDHKPLWGWRVGAYLFTKSLAAGIPLVGWAALGPALLERSAASLFVLASAIFFLALTCVLLVTDLKRPERFLYILLRPNWNSWLTRGSVILGVYGALLVVLLLGVLFRWTLPAGPATGLLAATAVAGILTAAYTAWLFAQAKGRVLFMRRGLAVHLVVQALVAGSAFLLLTGSLAGSGALQSTSAWFLLFGLYFHFCLMQTEGLMAPRRREEEYHRTTRLITHGPFAERHWLLGVGMGVIVPVLLLMAPGTEHLSWLAAFLALAGLYSEEDTFVRAAQALPIS